MLSVLAAATGSGTGSGSIARGQADPSSSPLAAPLADRPDVVVIMLDDLGYIPDDRILSRLPNIRRIFLDGGLRLNGMHNETPLCCPARVNLLTGQHTLRHGVLTNHAVPFDEARTLPAALRDTGYHTIMVGKYLNDYESPTMRPAGWDEIVMTNSRRVPDFWIDGELMAFPGMFYDDVVREQSVSRLQAAPVDRPVFMMVTPRAPHRDTINCDHDRSRYCTYFPAVMEGDRDSPHCAGIEAFKPPSYFILPGRREHPKDMPRWPDGWDLRKACESLLVIDRMAAGLVEAQTARGRPGYLFLMSDNGMAWGQKSHPHKGVPPATRLPFYAAGPGIPAGGESTVLLSIIDVGPTIAEIAGVPMPWADGVSFAPLLAGEAFPGRRMLLEVMVASPPGDNDRYLGWAAIRTRKWRYVRWDSGAEELYKVRTDPWELRDLVRSQPDRAARLSARLDRAIEESRG